MKVNNKRVAVEIEVTSLHSLYLILLRSRRNLSVSDSANTPDSEAYSDTCRLLDELCTILSDSTTIGNINVR